jgi:O-methyltransferase involved in polyketide biosynthesis
MSPDDLLWYAPVFEIRYKSVTAAIKKSGCRQILELAAGLSLRGFTMSGDRNLTYLESDLPEITAEKVRLIAALRRKYSLPDRGNLHFPVANALDASELGAAVRLLRRGQPLAIVHEGLLPYLSQSELQVLGQNIRDLLSIFGGVWITPDFVLKESVENISEQQRKFRRIVAVATDRTLYDNAFASNGELESFFGRLGLRSQVFNSVDECLDVVSVKTLNLSPQIVERLRPRARLWVLAAKHIH